MSKEAEYKHPKHLSALYITPGKSAVKRHNLLKTVFDKQL
jgi:hypothetical protein